MAKTFHDLNTSLSYQCVFFRRIIIRIRRNRSWIDGKSGNSFICDTVLVGARRDDILRFVCLCTLDC